MSETPSDRIESADGTPIAVFRSGFGPPLVLVHGASADHTTWRVAGPRLAERFTVHAIDRRGRGASGDGPRYVIEREYEDLRAVADAVAVTTGQPVGVVGHSFGGRVALGAATLTDAVAAVVCYEGAPAPAGTPYRNAALVKRLERLLAQGRPEALLETFLAEVVGMGDADLAAYRANPVWPARVAAAPTIVRELIAEATPAADLEALGRVEVPVLLVLGSLSREPFHAATAALAARLRSATVAVIDGARHAAHHSHADRFVSDVTHFLAAARS